MPKVKRLSIRSAAHEPLPTRVDTTTPPRTDVSPDLADAEIWPDFAGAEAAGFASAFGAGASSARACADTSAARIVAATLARLMRLRPSGRPLGPPGRHSKGSLPRGCRRMRQA